MLSEAQIHKMFYENGKIKDRKDPSQRVTRKLYWSQYFHAATIKAVEEEFGKHVKKMEDMPFIANLAYSGFSFVQAINAWRKIANITSENHKPEIIKKSKVELYAFLGYIDALKRNIDNINKNTLVLEPIFAFENFKKLLMCSGIRLEDSKVLSRASNLKFMLTSALKSKRLPKAKIKEELEVQYEFLSNILKEICFAPDEDFVIYLLRFDLKKL